MTNTTQRPPYPPHGRQTLQDQHRLYTYDPTYQRGIGSHWCGREVLQIVYTILYICEYPSVTILHFLFSMFPSAVSLVLKTIFDPVIFLPAGMSSGFITSQVLKSISCCNSFCTATSHSSAHADFCAYLYEIGSL